MCETGVFCLKNVCTDPSVSFQLCYLHADLFKNLNAKETKKHFVEFCSTFLDKGAVSRITHPIIIFKSIKTQFLFDITTCIWFLNDSFNQAHGRRKPIECVTLSVFHLPFSSMLTCPLLYFLHRKLSLVCLSLSCLFYYCFLSGSWERAVSSFNHSFLPFFNVVNPLT